MRHSAGTWSGKTSEVPAFPNSFDGKMRPGIDAQTGMHFPNERLAESTSHSEPKYRDALSLEASLQRKKGARANADALV